MTDRSGPDSIAVEQPTIQEPARRGSVGATDAGAAYVARDAGGVDEFQIYLDHVNKLVERRQQVTQTYISVNAALTGAMAFLLSGPRTDNGLSTVVLLCAGVIAATFWRRIIAQYRVLLDWWYAQLRTLEATHPGENKLVTKEYQELYLTNRSKARRSKFTLGLADYEIGLTWLFTAIYALAGLAIVANFMTHRF